MTFREHLKSVLSMYFIIVTLINAATFILGEIFRPEERFGYDAFLSPLIYAAIALVPILCMYSKKELTLKQHIIREVFQLIALEIILIGFGLGSKSLDPANLALTASFALSIFVITVLVEVISWLLDLKTARQLTDELKAFQNRVSKQSE
ncbi:MAG: hypothetical protein ACI4KM_09955 [Oscillospiraceae bacterium]